MQNANDAISNPNDLYMQVVILQQLTKTLLEYQKDLGNQINKLKSLSIKEIVRDVLLELNKTNTQSVTSFDDLLVITSKMALKGSIKK